MENEADNAAMSVCAAAGYSGLPFFFSAAPLNVVPSAAKIFNTIRRHNEQQSHHYSLFLHKPPVTNNHWSPQIVKAPADRNCPQTVAW